MSGGATGADGPSASQGQDNVNQLAAKLITMRLTNAPSPDVLPFDHLPVAFLEKQLFPLLSIRTRHSLCRVSRGVRAVCAEMGGVAFRGHARQHTLNITLASVHIEGDQDASKSPVVCADVEFCGVDKQLTFSRAAWEKAFEQGRYPRALENVLSRVVSFHSHDICYVSMSCAPAYNARFHAWVSPYLLLLLDRLPQLRQAAFHNAAFHYRRQYVASPKLLTGWKYTVDDWQGVMGIEETAGKADDDRQTACTKAVLDKLIMMPNILRIREPVPEGKSILLLNAIRVLGGAVKGEKNVCILPSGMGYLTHFLRGDAVRLQIDVCPPHVVAGRRCELPAAKAARLAIAWARDLHIRLTELHIRDLQPHSDYEKNMWIYALRELSCKMTLTPHSVIPTGEAVPEQEEGAAKLIHLVCGKKNAFFTFTSTPAVQQEAIVIKLLCREWRDFFEVHFRLRRNMCLMRMRDKYAPFLGVSPHRLRFLYRGYHLKDRDTAASLGMIGNDETIDVEIKGGV